MEPVTEANNESGASEDATTYRAVVNDEGQYSIWPVEKPIPLGWRGVEEPGATGAKDQVLRHIETAWTDMRPRSLR